ncbi:MAG: hypothetical protein Q7Q73_07470 [Verrucomicrobiota bacterium JB024]|nr:hypothetical protein [Verrucomicrobiota bacterium JB024]
MPNYLSTQAAKLVNSPDSVDLIQEKALNPLRSLESGAKRGGLLFDFRTVPGGGIGWMGILKAGWTVNPFLSYAYTHEDLGTSVPISVGYTNAELTEYDLTAFANNINVSDPGQVGFLSGLAPTAMSTGLIKADSDRWIIVSYGTVIGRNTDIKVTVYIDLLL